MISTICRLFASHAMTRKPRQKAVQVSDFNVMTGGGPNKFQTLRYGSGGALAKSLRAVLNGGRCEQGRNSPATLCPNLCR